MTSIFFQPLIQTYATANISNLLSVVKDACSQILAVAEDKCASPSASVGAYRAILDSLEQPVFAFCHDTFSKDDGTMESTINWLLSLVDLVRKDRETKYTLRMHSVLAQVNPQEQIELEDDLRKLDDIHFRKQFSREVRTKAAKEGSEITLDQVLKGSTSSSTPGALNIGDDLGLNGYISDEDLDDISTEKPSRVTGEYKLPVLVSLVPCFIQYVRSVLFLSLFMP